MGEAHGGWTSATEIGTGEREAIRRACCTSEAVPAPAKRPRKKGWASEIAEQFRGIGFTREEADALELRGYTLQPPDFK